MLSARQAKLVGFGSDGAAVMTGHHNGVAAKLQQKAPHLVSAKVRSFIAIQYAQQGMAIVTGNTV